MKKLKPGITRNRLGEPFPGECQKSYCDYHDINMECFCSMGEEPMFATAGHGCPSYDDVLKRANLNELQKATIKVIGRLGIVKTRIKAYTYEAPRGGKWFHLNDLLPTLEALGPKRRRIIKEKMILGGSTQNITLFLTEKGLKILDQLEAENEKASRES